jgi:hypothetical protein
MLKNWPVAGILAGLAVFLWGAIAHMALGLGDSALKQLPQEEALLASMALVKQLGFDIAEMLIAAWLLWMAATAIPGFGKRVCVVVGMSLFAFFATDAPFWNWYEFPTRFIMDGLIDKLVGGALGGAVLAYLVGRRGGGGESELEAKRV